MEVNKEALYHLAAQEFKVFTEEITPASLQNPPFLDELCDDISNPNNKSIVAGYFRGSGKSSVISIRNPLWEIARNHNIRILLISATAAVSQMFLSEIMSNIARNEKYQEFAKTIDPKGIGVVPKLRPGKNITEDWSGSSMTIERDDINLKDPTINAVGLFGSILAKRADIICLDDVVTQENSFTPEQRQKVKDWVNTTVLPVLVPGGRFMYAGNIWSQGDLVHQLLSDPSFDVRKKRPAILHEPDHPELWTEWAKIRLDMFMEAAEKKQKSAAFYAEHKEAMDAGIILSWPERFAYGDLLLLRLRDSYSFSRMYMCDSSNRPDQKFKEEWLVAAMKKGENLKLQDTPHTEHIEVTTMGLDLAISQDAFADDTALVTLDLVRHDVNENIKKGDFIVRQIKRGKMTPKEVRDMVTTDFYVQKPHSICVESVGYQEAMVRDLEDKHLPVRGYHTGSEKWNSSVGVNSLAILAEQGKLILPFAADDPRTRELVTKMVNEMRDFPGDHTGDSLISLWFAYLEIQNILGTKYTIPSKATLSAIAPPLSQADAVKEADQQVIAISERERSANYWKNEERRVLGNMRKPR
jgi:hypothetical protein